MNLPEPIQTALAPLFALLPLDQAMSALCPRGGASPEARALVEAALKDPSLAGSPALRAGLWLYVDELDRSHTISQDLKDATGSYWHGIMHRREGDFSNSHYWLHRTGRHPAMGLLTGYDGHTLVDAADAAHPENPADVVQLQREEWANLFSWCAARAVG